MPRKRLPSTNCVRETRLAFREKLFSFTSCAYTVPSLNRLEQEIADIPAPTQP